MNERKRRYLKKWIAIRADGRCEYFRDHFEADSSGLLIGKSPIGQATIKLLALNDQERIKERLEMIISGCYP